jgi:hypothetical protein
MEISSRDRMESFELPRQDYVRISVIVNTQIASPDRLIKS